MYFLGGSATGMPLSLGPPIDCIYLMNIVPTEYFVPWYMLEEK